MDCVSDAGEVAILHSARVRWRGIGLAYSNLIFDGWLRRQVYVDDAWRKDPSQGETDSCRVAATWASGTMDGACAPVERTVYACESGSVVWNCLQPAASVSLSVGEKKLTGAGYAECLTLTLPPWQLPLRHLQWGRFVSDCNALTR